MRPADVVEHEQWQRLLACGGDDQPELLGHGVVVVVAVDHVGIGARQVRQGLVAGLLHQLQFRVLLGERDELLLRRGVDRPDACLRGLGPLKQEPGQVSGIGADLDHRCRPATSRHAVMTSALLISDAPH